MGKVFAGLNAEYSRSSDKPFEWAVEEAAKMGYKYFEPMVHFGRELMSEAGYFHTVSMFDDPYRIKDACDAAGLKISGLQSHGPLGRPDVHGEYIKLAIRTAAEIDVSVINTDEGISDVGEVGLAYGTGHSAGAGMAKNLAENFVLGADPFKSEKLWETMFRSSFWAQGGGPVFRAGPPHLPKPEAR